jgi:hypothetical protein
VDSEYEGTIVTEGVTNTTTMSREKVLRVCELIKQLKLTTHRDGVAQLYKGLGCIIPSVRHTPIIR